MYNKKGGTTRRYFYNTSFFRSLFHLFNSKSQKYETCLNNENVEEEIRSVNVSEVVSIISKIKEVREKECGKGMEVGWRKSEERKNGRGKERVKEGEKRNE